MVEPFEPLFKEDRATLTAEGERLVRFIGEGAEAYELRVVEKT